MFDFGTPIQNHFLAYRKLLGMVNPDIMFSPFRSCLCVVFSLGSLGSLWKSHSQSWVVKMTLF